MTGYISALILSRMRKNNIPIISKPAGVAAKKIYVRYPLSCDKCLFCIFDKNGKKSGCKVFRVRHCPQRPKDLCIPVREKNSCSQAHADFIAEYVKKELTFEYDPWEEPRSYHHIYGKGWISGLDRIDGVECAHMSFEDPNVYYDIPLTDLMTESEYEEFLKEFSEVNLTEKIYELVITNLCEKGNIQAVEELERDLSSGNTIKLNGITYALSPQDKADTISYLRDCLSKIKKDQSCQ